MQKLGAAVLLLLLATASANRTPQVGCKKPPVNPKPKPQPLSSPPPMPVCQSAWDVLSSHSELSVLKTALEIGAFKPMLEDRELSATIFAPTNDAVSVCWKVGCLTVDTLKYHVIPATGYKALSLLATGNPSAYYMANGGIASVWYNNANGVFTVKAPTNSAMVIKADIPFCKGYIHVIDTVLNPSPMRPNMPPAPPAPPSCLPTAWQLISSTPQFAGFKLAIERTNRTAFFNDPELMATLFVPLISDIAPAGLVSAADWADAVDSLIVPGSPIAFPSPLAGQTLITRSGRRMVVSYDASASGPQDLRLNSTTGGISVYLNPGTVSIRRCNYIIHSVGQIAYHVTRQSLVGK